MFILSQNNKVEIEPRMLWIPEFKDIWERDHTKTKAKAKMEFAYVYFMEDYKSEYNIYGVEKPRFVAEDILNDPFYHPDELVQKAMDKYCALQETFSMRYLKSVRETVNSLMKFYDELRYRSGQTNAKDYDPVPVTKALKEVESILEKLEKWEKKVMSEEDNMQIRGGGKIGLFEDKENASWMKAVK